jgi:three-Cys-motif partner protein
MLEFHDDAIVLSGVTGTKLKSDIIGKYYWQWWKITSRGEGRDYSNPTAIVEMNAGSGENYIPETNEIVLGSAGHALELKDKGQNTSHMKVIIVEESEECSSHLKNVLQKRWPSIKYVVNSSSEIIGGTYIFNNAKHTLESIDGLELGNSLFFFDDLRYTQWSELEFVAEKRITQYYKTGTEFIIFLFTSDWFTGRKELVPLPTTNHERDWTVEQKSAVNDVDQLFGNMLWRSSLLNSTDIQQKIQTIVNLYRQRLHKWFRYVLPMPFMSKSFLIGLKKLLNELGLR